jgi:hypothetical protein
VLALKQVCSEERKQGTMDRRRFNKLASLVAIGTMTEGAQLYAKTGTGQDATLNSSEEVVLQDKELLVAFDKASGAITRFVRKSTNWVIERRPELGVSFRLLVPLPNRRTNFVLGNRQRALRVEKLSETNVEIIWRDPVSEHGGVLPITLTAMATLVNGALTFDLKVDNNSTLTIETIDYPYFGDLNPPTPNEGMQTEHMWYGNLAGTEIYPHFGNEKGYWGVNFPTKTVDSKQSLFCLIQAARQGLYVEMHDPTQPYLLQFTFEQHPGVVQSTNNLVPRTDEISGLTVHLEFRACHFIFAEPQSTKKLAPVVLRSYDGDWRAGIDVYKQWRAAWFKDRKLPEWINSVHSWLQLQIDGAEQDFAIPYRELPKYIDECAANGVTAIQLVGWNIGGQDGGDPSLDTDPGLGTWEELRKAISYARGKGVKMILFGKPIWADRTTELCKTELYKYAATDPFGIPYETGGYSYTTPTQLAGINNRRRYIMDVQSPAYRDIATREFQKTLDLGAAGWLFDEVCHHGPVEYSFSSDHGYKGPGYIYGGDMPMAKQFRDAADKVNPDFIFAGEGPQDWLLQYYPVSYFRIDNGSRAVCRYIDSKAPLMVAVTGIDDREKLNLLLLNRYIISYEPYNFKGHVTDFPMTLAYGKKIDALRSKYKAWLWDAEFRDTLGAGVESDGNHRHSVFVAENGKRAVVVVNMESQKTITATVKLPNPGTLVTATPEHLECRPTSGTLQIPARSAAVIMES